MYKKKSTKMLPLVKCCRLKTAATDFMMQKLFQIYLNCRKSVSYFAFHSSLHECLTFTRQTFIYQFMYEPSTLDKLYRPSYKVMFKNPELSMFLLLAFISFLHQLRFSFMLLPPNETIPFLLKSDENDSFI